MNYGYARVSTVNQNLDRQIDDLLKLGINEKQIYTDKESGRDFNRTNYRKLLKKLKPGDVLFIKAIDRLGRNYNMVLNEWRILIKEKGVDIVVIDMPPLDIPENFMEIVESYKRGEITSTEAVIQSKLTRGTFYRKLKLIS